MEATTPVIGRSATGIRREEDIHAATPNSRLLSEWRDVTAYVLLGEPGSGKTTSFQAEAQALGKDGLYITARDFLTIALSPDETRKVLFIDALDERLTAATDRTTPFDNIRSKLSQIESPRFRISCREADWITGGAKALQSAVRGVLVQELALDPLSDLQILEILKSYGPERVREPHAFVAEALRRGVDHLLRNPLLIDLLVRAVRDNKWPKTRDETYNLACERLAQEQNPEHRLHLRTRPSTAELLRIAEGICSTLLLSDKAVVSMDAEGSSGDAVSVDTVASELSINQDVLIHCLNSKLFAAEGVYRAARHRTIAEFLGGRALAKLAADGGVPLPRLLTLMLGYDGRVVEPLRGLYAWLAVHDQRDRQLLLAQDPLALVLYGDVQRFTVVEKTRLLEALHREAERYRWFRSENRTEQPFGSLGTPDMEHVLRGWLSDPSRDPAHQSTLDCVIDAIQHGDDRLNLLGELECLIRDDTYDLRIRTSALDAWLSQPSFDLPKALTLLEDIRLGKVSDNKDEITGSLLSKLYPGYLAPADALRYLRPSKDGTFIGDFRMFWDLSFLLATPVRWHAEIADLLARRAKRKDVLDDEDSADPVFEHFRELIVKAVSRAIQTAGDTVHVERLHAWLDACLGKYRSLQGSDDSRKIRTWLEARPATMADLYRVAIMRTEADRDGVRRFGGVSLILMHAALPSDWHRRLLTFAQASDSVDEAARYVREAAEAAVEPERRFDITLDDIDIWLRENATRWPDAVSWVESATSWPLDSFQSKEYKYRIDSSEKRLQERSKRQRSIAPQLAKIGSTEANPKLLYHVANTFWAERSGQFEGTTAAERIADMLVAGPSEASQALQGVLMSLDREDLPSVTEIFDLWRKGSFYYLSYACQLAAQMRFAKDAESVRHIPAPAFQKLIAFHLLQGAPGDRGWFKTSCIERPQEVAEVMLPHLEAELRTKVQPTFDSVLTFRAADGPIELARITVPRLLDAFPYATTESLKLHLLDSVLLRGGRLSLDPSSFQNLVASHLTPSASALSQISLHTALLGVEGDLHCAAIESLCTDKITARHLATAIEEQAGIDDAFVAANPDVSARVARLLVRATERVERFGNHEDSIISEAAESLIRHLGSSPSVAAGKLLARLRESTESSSWRLYLDWRMFEHTKLARAAQFAAPSFASVCGVVGNGAPANHRDLAELLRHHLMHAAERIHHEEVNSLELFYREGAKGKEPKIENDCRDVLLGLVRDRITQQGASFDKEAYAAGDKRADLRGSLVRADRMSIPIEVKKDNHSEVWTAWRDQLHARYTANPEAGGIGIYLVLWFGVKTKRAPNGKTPKTAEEMASMLNAMIQGEFRQTTLGLVIDLSRSVRR